MKSSDLKIAIYLSQNENLKILTGFLKQFYTTISASKIEDIYEADMLITDGLYLKEYFSSIKALKESSGIIFFPVLLVTNVKEAGLSTSNVWQVADELINIPVVKIELLSRVKILLKTRELSLDQRVEYVEHLKQEKKKVEESELKFKSIFENHAAIKLIIDPESGQIFAANDAAAAYYGWTVDELKSKTIFQINTSTADEINKMMEKARTATKLEFEFKHRHANGLITNVVVYSSKVHIDGKDYLHSIIYDITEKKKAEKRIKLLGTSVEQSPASIVITDAKGIIEYVNPFFTFVTGYSFDEAVGKTARILNAGVQNKTFYRNLWDTILSGKTWQGEFCNKKKNGEIYWENAIIAPILDENKITHFVGVKEDVTEKRNIVKELIEEKEKAEESDRLKTSFLHNVSHEIRTPLNAIVGFSSVIAEPETSPEARNSFGEIIKKSSDHLLSVVDDILKLASIEAGQDKLSKTDTNINTKLELLYEEFSPQANEKNISFEYKAGLPAEESIISLDETKFLQILTNLLSNAFKFTHKGNISFGYHLKENNLEFYVEDTGIGIPSKYHEQIFERFHKVEIEGTKLYGGSGIGLAISKAYAEMLGGNIWLKSEEGKGSVFYFSLPYNKLKQQVITEDQIDVETVTLENSIKTLLVAEDEEFNFIYIKTLLSRDNFRLLRANNGQEAVDICESNPQIDLILMDIKMPVMNGYEASMKIKELRPNLPIIAQTAYSTAIDRNKAFESGCSDFISKPFTKENLLAKIASQLNTNNI